MGQPGSGESWSSSSGQLTWYKGRKALSPGKAESQSRDAPVWLVIKIQWNHHSLYLLTIWSLCFSFGHFLPSFVPSLSSSEFLRASTTSWCPRSPSQQAQLEEGTAKDWLLLLRLPFPPCTREAVECSAHMEGISLVQGGSVWQISCL